MDLIDYREVHILRLLVLADTLDLVRLRLRPLSGTKHFREYGSLRICADDANAGILFLQISGDSRNCSSGSHSNDHVGHLAFSLFPDLWTRRSIVSECVCRVLVLIGEIAVRNLLAQPKGDRMVAAWI